MQLKSLKVCLLAGNSAADLQQKITTFLRDGGEATFVEAHYAMAAGVYSCLILYAN